MTTIRRAFLGRCVRFLAAEAGIRQFLDIGTGIPAAGNTHEVALDVDPDCRAYNEAVTTPQTRRSRDEVARFFTGLDLVDPGLVQLSGWRPAAGDLPAATSGYGAVARKP
jgi:S-adenosyl methyltransferase